MAESDIAHMAGLIGDPARSRMLMALMGGKALTASELALEADVTPQTASSHLSKLVARELLVVRKQGRHRYFQLRGSEVAELLESLLTLSTKPSASTLFTGPRDPQLRKARVCYDHLAGEYGILIFDSLIANGYLKDDGDITLTDSGSRFFTTLGVNVVELKNKKRPLCKACLDWSERRNHLAGALGKWILDDIFANKWAHKALNSRVVRFSESGLARFKKRYTAL